MGKIIPDMGIRSNQNAKKIRKKIKKYGKKEVWFYYNV